MGVAGRGCWRSEAGPHEPARLPALSRLAARAPALRPGGGSCHITQPVLSNALRALQQDLGCDAAHPRGTLRPGIVPVVLSMSSQALEAGLENIAQDLALGYTVRMPARGGQLKACPQYVAHYFLPRRAPGATARGLQRRFICFCDRPICICNLTGAAVVPDTAAARQPMQATSYQNQKPHAPCPRSPHRSRRGRSVCG